MGTNAQPLLTDQTFHEAGDSDSNLR